MAIHASNTPAPGFQRRLLRAARLLAPTTAELTQTPALTPESVAMLDAMPAAPDALLPLLAPLPSLSAALSQRRAIFGAVEIDEPDTAAQARALHMRRELRKGLDHGLALMDTLDLSPRGLDLMDRAIAQLDALEAPDEDMEEGGDAEPSLGWIAGQSHLFRDYQDCELDSADAEEDDPAEETSLETAGRGLVRCGADDVEDDDGCERGEEYGSEDGEDIGHHASQFAPRPLSHAERAEVAAIVGRAATMRRASHG